MDRASGFEESNELFEFRFDAAVGDSRCEIHLESAHCVVADVPVLPDERAVPDSKNLESVPCKSVRPPFNSLLSVRYDLPWGFREYDDASFGNCSDIGDRNCLHCLPAFGRR